MSKKKKPDTIRVKFHLSIGYPTATHEDIVEYDREDWESMTEDEKHQEAQEWANGHIEVYFEEDDE